VHHAGLESYRWFEAGVSKSNVHGDLADTDYRHIFDDGPGAIERERIFGRRRHSAAGSDSDRAARGLRIKSSDAASAGGLRDVAVVGGDLNGIVKRSRGESRICIRQAAQVFELLGAEQRGSAHVTRVSAHVERRTHQGRDAEQTDSEYENSDHRFDKGEAALAAELME